MSDHVKSLRFQLFCILGTGAIGLLLVVLGFNLMANERLRNENDDLRASIQIYQRILHEHNIQDPSPLPKEPM